MKTNYFTKVEDKYVFNISLIFWHLFIAIATLSIVVSIFIFLWSVIPSSERKVEKQAYPAKQEYPAPVMVAINELNLEEIKQVDPLPDIQITYTPPAKQVYEDLTGLDEYENSLKVLKTLIPPSKYSWDGKGDWYYPQGKRYWDTYQNEIYRKWIASEPGIEDKLKTSYKTSNANNYLTKKQILDGYINVLKVLPEEKRLNSLEILMNNLANNIDQNLKTFQSLVGVVSIMKNEKNNAYLRQLVLFGNRNPNDGSALIDYTASIIAKFDTSQRVSIINNLLNGYYSYFNQQLPSQKEATDLFLQLIPQIKASVQSKAINQYYSLYINKNISRNNKIQQIEQQYQAAMNQVDNDYALEISKAQIEFESNKEVKHEYRYKSMLGVGSGILSIVLIASVLVFLSIQRSVRRIEEKIEGQNIP